MDHKPFRGIYTEMAPSYFAEDDYLNRFSISYLKKLFTEDKEKHTLVDYAACYESH